MIDWLIDMKYKEVNIYAVWYLLNVDLFWLYCIYFSFSFLFRFLLPFFDGEIKLYINISVKIQQVNMVSEAKLHV